MQIYLAEESSPKFSDLEVIALSATAEARGIDSENLLFKRLEAEKGDLLPNLISRRQYNQCRKLTSKLGEDIRWGHRCCHGRQGGCVQHRLQAGQGVSERPRQAPSVMGRDDFERAPAWGYCASQGMHYYGYKLHAICGISGVIHSFDMTAANVHDLHYLKDVKWEYHDRMILGDKGYLSAAIQLDLFETAHITLEVPYRLNQKNWRPPTWAYKRFRKRIETLFSQLNDQFMMIRNYAKQPLGLFTRTAAKVAALTVLQYVNYVNHRQIGQVKYALI